jgi:hypothetical protein
VGATDRLIAGGVTGTHRANIPDMIVKGRVDCWSSCIALCHLCIMLRPHVINTVSSSKKINEGSAVAGVALLAYLLIGHQSHTSSGFVGAVLGRLGGLI